ncbi:hypothetical protein [Streptomyces sp. TE5632]
MLEQEGLHRVDVSSSALRFLSAKLRNGHPYAQPAAGFGIRTTTHGIGSLTRLMYGPGPRLGGVDVDHVLVPAGLVHLPVARGAAPRPGALAILRFSHRPMMCWSRPAW